MKLAIADPPYPQMIAAGGRKRRASRWYGDGLATSDRRADYHHGAAEWDDPATHRALLLRLLDEFDGWAIATSPDGIAAYGELPAPIRIMAWVKPNGQPGAHRLRSCWEPVLIYPPEGRRSNRGGRGQIPDVLTAAAPRVGFVGAKPPEWTRWVLDALCYDATTDTVTDLFPGSGMVGAALAQTVIEFGGSWVGRDEQGRQQCVHCGNWQYPVIHSCRFREVNADARLAADASRCTCNYVAMPSMVTGKTTYVPGRRDPNCPTHPRDGAA